MKIKTIILFSAILLSSGCAGLQDYDYDLANDYMLSCSSAHQITIIPKTGYSQDETTYIPPKVIEIAWNERYVIAKQYGMKRRSPDNPEDTYEEPDKTKIYYWILDTLDKKRYGPFNSIEFNEQIKIFKLEKLKLKPVENYRTNR